MIKHGRPQKWTYLVRGPQLHQVHSRGRLGLLAQRVVIEKEGDGPLTPSSLNYTNA